MLWKAVASRPPESMLGAPLGMGFLQLYEMLTGSCTVKVGKHDDSLTVATLLWHYYGDAHDRNRLWSSLISLLVHNRGAVDAVPRFKDNRGTKIPTFLGSVTEEQPVSPLNELLADLVKTLRELEEAGSLTVPADPATYPSWPEPTEAERTVTVYATHNDDKAARRPRTTDFMCDKRTLRLPNFALLRERLGFEDVSQGLLGIATSDLADMAGTPLSQLRPAEYFTAAEKGAGDGVGKGLPFNVTEHPDAKSPVAKQMEARLIEDCQCYAKQQVLSLSPQRQRSVGSGPLL